MRRRVAAGLSALAALSSACQAQEGRAPATSETGRGADFYAACEGCDAALERDPASLGARVRIAPPGERGEPLTLRGVVRGPDGRTPAAGVVVYVHQTDADGRYSRGSDATEWSRRHGLLRGWAKTGADGRYEFTTIKPAPYPGRSGPAHIHLTVVEPGDRPYWIDDVVFAGEFGIDAAYLKERRNRGGPGVVALSRSADGSWLAQRDIVLERR